jgi:opacity protein-like surface antigen
MKRLAFAAVVAGILASPAAAANCAKDYKDFWDGIGREGYAKMSGEQFAKLSRTALRGYDACSAGDQPFNGPEFYKRLGQQAYALPDDFWEKLQRDGQVKK